eukprot:7383741-Prymnesium_polylepis.1
MCKGRCRRQPKRSARFPTAVAITTSSTATAANGATTGSAAWAARSGALHALRWLAAGARNAAPRALPLLGAGNHLTRAARGGLPRAADHARLCPPRLHRGHAQRARDAPPARRRRAGARRRLPDRVWPAAREAGGGRRDRAGEACRRGALHALRRVVWRAVAPFQGPDRRQPRPGAAGARRVARAAHSGRAGDAGAGRAARLPRAHTHDAAVRPP